MNLPYERWYHAITVRHSRRQYLDKPLSEDDRNSLDNIIEDLNASFSGVRIVLILENTDSIFKGIVGSYGKIKNSPAFAAFIGNTKDPNVEEKIGYMGESFILEATSLNLGTCWVSGTFSRDAAANDVNLNDDEFIYAVTPVGYADKNYSAPEKLMKLFTSSRKRKELDELCDGIPQNEWSEWITTSLEAARLAPSAVNLQPWKFTVSKDSIKISENNTNKKFPIKPRLDCGITMLHIKIGAMHAGVKGSYEYLNSPDVAVFKINK